MDKHGDLLESTFKNSKKNYICKVFKQQKMVPYFRNNSVCITVVWPPHFEGSL